MILRINQPEDWYFFQLQQLFLQSLHVTSIMDCALAGDSPTQMSLTGRDIMDQHSLLLQAPIKTILVGQVRYLAIIE